MKYAIWRHENALGNSGEHTVGLAKHLARVQDAQPEIYVETEFQKCFALCIPGTTSQRIHFIDKGLYDAVMNKSFGRDPRYHEIHMPNAYHVPGMKTYPACWADLSQPPDCTLRFPREHYENRRNLPSGAIVIQVREPNTFWKRSVGANEDPQRSVAPQTFFKVAEYFADKGFPIVRLGDKNQTPFPRHKNIRDFALESERDMLDDLFLISESRVFLSCDSGIWPIAGGMKKNLVLSNVTSVYGPQAHFKIENGQAGFILDKPAIVDWLDPRTTRVLYKKVRFVPKAEAGRVAGRIMRGRWSRKPDSKGVFPYRFFPLKDLSWHNLRQIGKDRQKSMCLEIQDNTFEELVQAIESFL